MARQQTLNDIAHGSACLPCLANRGNKRLRNHDSASLLICIWFSAPLGIVLAEIIRRRLARNPALPARDQALARAAVR